MDDKIVIVLDCGATNVRAIAVNQIGEILAKESLPNNTQPDPFLNGGLIWDVEEIWAKMASCCKKVCQQIETKKVCAITVTTFGVNGAPIDKFGNLLYPVISWQCQRTVPIMNNINKYISSEELYGISGISKFHFNTINTLIWLKENKPEIVDQMKGWLFIPSIFVHKLTGEKINDTSMLGTSMLAENGGRVISKKILSAINIPNRFFDIKEPGEIVGQLNAHAANKLNLLEGTPVVLAGHDTQFAVFGSGADENEPVLSSGTWEILMARTKNVDTSKVAQSLGLTNEFDAIPGLYNSGVQWIASGVLEWIKNLFYKNELNLSSDALYELMIKEAESAKEGCVHIEFEPDLLKNMGSIKGLGLQTKREEIYLAALQALALKTRDNLELLENAGGFKAKSIIVVGGGSKNKLWNQLRANALKIPVKLIEQTETTVLGAAMFALSGIGMYESPYKAKAAFKSDVRIIYPE